MDLIDGKNGLCGEIAVAAGFEGYEIPVIYRTVSIVPLNLLIAGDICNF
jgi:hypothetical protein